MRNDQFILAEIRDSCEIFRKTKQAFYFLKTKYIYYIINNLKNIDFNENSFSLCN